MPEHIQDPGDFQIVLPVLAHLVAAVGGLQVWVMRSMATSTQRYKLWYSNFSDKPVGLTVPQKHENCGGLLPPFLKWKGCFVLFFLLFAHAIYFECKAFKSHVFGNSFLFVCLILQYWGSNTGPCTHLEIVLIVSSIPGSFKAHSLKYLWFNDFLADACGNVKVLTNEHS